MKILSEEEQIKLAKDRINRLIACQEEQIKSLEYSIEHEERKVFSSRILLRLIDNLYSAREVLNFLNDCKE